MRELIRTPVTLDILDKEHAVFTGSAEETMQQMVPFAGSIEVTGHYPAVFLQRQVWEDMDRPVMLMLILEGDGHV